MSGISSRFAPPTPVLDRSGSETDLSTFPRRVLDVDSGDYVFVSKETAPLIEKRGSRPGTPFDQTSPSQPRLTQPSNNETDENTPISRLRALSHDFNLSSKDNELERACCCCACSIGLLALSFFSLKSKSE